MRTRSLRVAGVGLLLAVGLVLPGCGDDVTAPATDNMTIRLTDAPSDELTEVNVYFDSLKVKRSGEPVEHDVPIVLVDNPQDLLVLDDQVVLLATAELEPGTYEFISIDLDEDQSYVVDLDGEAISLRIPSEKIKVMGPFEVFDEGTTEVTLDFDADESLQRLGNGDWLMTPVIVVTGVDSDS